MLDEQFDELMECDHEVQDLSCLPSSQKVRGLVMRTSIRELAAPTAARPNPGLLLQVAGCGKAFRLCVAHASLPSLCDSFARPFRGCVWQVSFFLYVRWCPPR
jgi:hypothetical protein